MANLDELDLYSESVELLNLLNQLSKKNEPPGAIAGISLVAAIAAHIASSGTSVSENARRLLEFSHSILQKGDDDTKAYWLDSNVNRDEWREFTPEALLEVIDEAYHYCMELDKGNIADINVARVLMISTSSSIKKIIEYNSISQNNNESDISSTLLAGNVKDSTHSIVKAASAYRCYVTDDYGKKWMDITSGMWNVPLGHANPDVISGFLSQSIDLATINPFIASSSIVDNAAKKITEIINRKNDKVFFCSSGSEAIEAALRMAIGCFSDFEKVKVWSLPNSFHGCTAGAASLSGFESIWRPLPANKRIGTPCPPSQWTVPGVGFVEPLSASNNLQALTEEWIDELKKFQLKGGIIIADEVASGIGRMAWPILLPSLGFNADFIVLGKGLSNGLIPLSCVVISEKCYNVLQDGEYLDYGHTHSNHPAAAAAALGCLNALERIDYASAASKFHSSMKKISSSPVKGSGFMLSIGGINPISRNIAIDAMIEAKLIIHIPTVMTELKSIIVAPPINISDDELVDLENRLNIFMRLVNW